MYALTTRSCNHTASARHHLSTKRLFWVNSLDLNFCCRLSTSTYSFALFVWEMTKETHLFIKMFPGEEVA